MRATDPKTRVLILGYGEMGHAMETLLGSRHALTIWQRRPPTGPPVALDIAVPEAEVILFCLPATAHEEVAGRIRPFLSKETLCVTIAKGLDGSGRIPAEVLGESLGKEAVAVIYGPMIAEEIRAGKAAFAQFASTDTEATGRIAGLYRGSALRLEPSSDLAGLSWSAVLKNVYAIAFGLADELELGDNVRGFLTVTALHELDAIVRALGGAPATPFHLAGLGDLITTATSSGSHHHDLGRRLARSEHGLAGEGIHTLDVLRARPRFDVSHYPLFGMLDAAVREPESAGKRCREFMNRADE